MQEMGLANNEGERGDGENTASQGWDLLMGTWMRKGRGSMTKEEIRLWSWITKKEKKGQEN